MAQNSSLAIFERKINEHKLAIEELADEYASNDDGDIELRDVSNFVMDMIKLIKIEIESSNMMADFVLSKFVKEFVEYAKVTKKLKNLSSVLLPLDIQILFTSYLK